MWVRFNDNTPNDPEIDALSDGAFRLWFSAICFAQQELTDGWVPARMIRRLTPNYKPPHLKELLAPSDNPSGPILTPHNDGYLIRNFGKYNKTRDHWTKKRAADAERMAKWRAERGTER